MHYLFDLKPLGAEQTKAQHSSIFHFCSVHMSYQLHDKTGPWCFCYSAVGRCRKPVNFSSSLSLVEYISGNRHLQRSGPRNTSTTLARWQGQVDPHRDHLETKMSRIKRKTCRITKTVHKPRCWNFKTLECKLQLEYQMHLICFSTYKQTTLSHEVHFKGTTAV